MSVSNIQQGNMSVSNIQQGKLSVTNIQQGNLPVSNIQQDNQSVSNIQQGLSEWQTRGATCDRLYINEEGSSSHTCVPRVSLRPELIPPTDVRYCVGKQCDNGVQFIIEYNQLARCGAFHLCDVLGELHDDDDDDDAVPRRGRIPAPKSADSCHHVSTLSYFTRYVYYIVLW